MGEGGGGRGDVTRVGGGGGVRGPGRACCHVSHI